MEFLTWLLCFALFLILFQAFRGQSRRTGKLPPGPPTIPIFGNLFDVGDKPHRSPAKLAKVHGDIMTLKLGQTTTIVISSATMAKEILRTHDAVFCNRTVPDALHALRHHEVGLPWMTVSTRWRNLRKICNLHVFAGHKLDANQYLRHKKVEQLLADVRDSSRIREAIDIGTAILKTAVNLMSNTVFSIDLADSSDAALKFGEVIQGMKEELGKPNFADYFPTLLGNLDLQGIRYRMTIQFQKLMNLFDKLIDDRLDSRKMNEYISTNDLLDTLLQISQDDNQELDRKQIKHFIFGLFTAGTETTTSTSEWAMAELLRDRKTLLEARRELQQVIGQGKMVDEPNITRLPYLQAIVKETLRLHPPVPLLVPRKAEADIEICNFVVPRGAQVLINAWGIGRDPSCWEEPDLFLPKRFIGSEMDVKGRDFGLIPFGGGRRICPGLPLAIRMLHLVLGNLIHSFDWELEDGVTPENLNMDDAYGMFLQKAQRLRAIPRSI